MARFKAGAEVAYRPEGASAPDDFEMVVVIDRIDEGVYRVQDENGLCLNASVMELHDVSGKGEQEIEAHFRALAENERQGRCETAEGVARGEAVAE